MNNNNNNGITEEIIGQASDRAQIVRYSFPATITHRDKERLVRLQEEAELAELNLTDWLLFKVLDRLEDIQNLIAE